MIKIGISRACGLGVAVLLTGCGVGPDDGFTLPEGDISAGKTAFVSLGCQSCHTVKGVSDLAEPASETEMGLELGGARPVAMTYDELVTSIINPAHKLSRLGGVSVGDTGEPASMPSFNDVMTVTQLVDIVTFLEAQYEIEPYRRTEYPPYGP